MSVNPSEDDRTYRTARDAWNARYAARSHLYGSGPNETIVDQVTRLAPGRALDMACGQGRNAVWLAGRGHEVTALDISDVAIAQASDFADVAGVAVEFRAIDVVREWIPEPGSFELVVLAYLQLPPTTRRTAHAKAQRALADGGTIVLVAHHADNMTSGVGGPPMPEVHYREDQLAEDFGSLSIELNEKVLRAVDVEGGVRHAHDVVLVATKR